MTANDHTASRSPMSVPTVGQQRLVILGASGMVGGYALRYALDSPAVKSVISVGRKKLRISHPKLKEVVHQNFALPWKSMLQSTSAESLLRSVLRSGRH